MKINNIARNTSYFTLALIIQKVITFSYFTILARNLAPAELGKYYLAFSFSSIFLTFIDIGQANILTREVGRNKENAKQIMGTIMAIKLPLIILTSLIVFALANLLGYEPLTRQLIYFSILVMIMDAMGTTFFAVIRGFHNLKYESVISVLTHLTIMGLGLLMLYLGFGLIPLMIAVVIGTSVRFFGSMFFLAFKWKISLLPKFDRKKIKSFLALTVPFALFGIFQKFYMFLDTVLLSKLAGDYHTGLYQIAFKIIFAMQFLPMAFIASLYPAFAGYYSSYAKTAESEKNNHQLIISFERGFNYLLLIAAPISVGVIAIADKILFLFKPEYMEAKLALQITIASLPFMFLNFPLGSLLNAGDRQKINTRNMGLTLALSAVLNIILIPIYKTEGAAATVLITNAFMFLLGMASVGKIIKLRAEKLLWPAFKILIAAVLMGFMAIILKSYMNIFLVVITAALVYFFSLLLFKVIKKEDVVSVMGSFK